MRDYSLIEAFLGEEKFIPKGTASIMWQGFMIGWAGYYSLVHYYVHEWVAILIVILIAGMQQVSNALIPAYGDDKVNYIGSYGFQWTGLAWNSIGVLFAFILDAMVPPSIGKDRPEGDDDDDCDDCDDDDM